MTLIVHRRIALLLALALAVAGVAFAHTSSAFAAGTASISGVVRDADGNLITSGDICISASAAPPFTSEGDFIAFARSGADGSYTLSGLRADTWGVRASDCPDGTRNDAQTPYPLGAVTVAAGQGVTGIDITLQPGATVSGHVYLGPGTDTPLTDACAEAWDVTAGGFGAGGAQTDVHGAYTITRLDPTREYRVSFGPCNTFSWPWPYTFAYYGGTGSDTAAILHLSATLPRTGIDGHLTASNASVSGVVKDANGDPIATGDVCVEAMATGSYRQATTGPDGAYSLIGLIAGTYTLHFADCSSSSRNDVPKDIEVSVGDSEAVTGMDVSLLAGASISGHVYGGPGTDRPLGGQCLTLWSSVTQSGSGGMTTAADGSYTIRHLDPAKSYRLGVGCGGLLPPGNLLDFVGGFYGGTSWDSATTLSPTLAQPLTGIDIHERPVFQITGGPTDGSTTSSPSATFTFDGLDGWALECAIDGAGFSACPATFATGDLAVGQHTLGVRATSGLVHTSTKTVAWTIATGDPSASAADSRGTTATPEVSPSLTPLVPLHETTASPRPKAKPLAPTAKLLSPSRLSLKSVLKSGLRLKLSCATTCTATVRLKLGRTALGSVRGSLTTKGRTLTVRLPSKAKSTLRRQRKAFKVAAAITVTSPGRTARVVTQSLTIAP